MEDQKERELRDSLARRRATLRETLKLQALQQPPSPAAVAEQPLGRGEEEEEVTTSFTQSAADAHSLFADLRERRLRRSGQLPPLEGTATSSLPPRMDAVEPLGTPPSPSHTHTPTPSQGHRDALRERLRNKLQLSQSERDSPLPPEEPPSGRRLRGPRNQPRVTRFDEPDVGPFHEEGDSPVPAHSLPSLTPAQSSAVRWKSLGSRLSETVQKTVEQESYDFFTGAIEDLTLPEAADGANGEGGRGEVGEGEGSQEELDTSALLEQQEDGDDGESDERGEADSGRPADQTRDSASLLCPGPPIYLPQRERLAREREVCFIPSTLPVPAEEKTPLSQPPRYLQDEGLYVGERPHVGWTNQAAVENRLLKRKDKGRGWFGEDGLLLCQPDPLRQIHARPLLLQYEGTEHLEFRNAKVETLNQKLLDKGYGQNTYQLDVDIASLHFTHHPLFSPEHVLASRLTQEWEQYRRRWRSNMAEYYAERLPALQRATHDLKQALQETDPSSPEWSGLESRLQQYRHEIRTVRQRKKKEEATDYHLLQSILRTWQELKVLRQTQGYSSSAVWLTVKGHPTNAVEEEAELRREVEEQLAELQEDFQRENAEREAQYQAQLAEWKAYQKARRKSLRRASRLQRQLQSQEGRTGSEQSGTEGSQTSLSQALAGPEGVQIPPDRPRPIAPPTFVEAQVRQEMMDWYERNRRSPGEPILVPELHHTHPISHQCPRDEQQRRDEAARVRIKVKILFNDQEVSETREGTLATDFTVHLGEIFNIQIVQWPESLKIQILEVGLLSPSLLAEVFLPIPEPQQTSSSGHTLEPYQFSCSKPATYTHTAVGSGEAHPSVPQSGILVTSGVLRVGVAWGVSDAGRVLCPQGFSQALAFHSPHTDAVSCLGVAGVADLQEVKRWIEQSNLDPNDPRNSELLDLVQTIPSSADEDQFFRLQEVEDCERFVSDEELSNSRRFRLLELRDQGHPGLKNKSVPLNSEGITESVWQSVQGYRPYSDYDLPLTFFGDFHSARKEKQNQFLLDVRERVLSRVRSGRGEVTLSDVVHCDIIPSIGALKASVVDLVSPKRPLKPKRRGKRKPKPQNVHVSSADITVRVVRAFNLPTRAHQDALGATAAPRQRPFSASHRPSLPLTPAHTTSTGGLQLPVSQSGTSQFTNTTAFQQENLNLVCPYVEVAFGGVVKKTTTACGPNPFWNEELSLAFHPPHDDFSPTNLQKVTEVLHISLFDEVIIDILQDDRQRATNVHHRIEKRWLGSFTLPFSTLHSRARIEGTFRLELPPVLLGYEHNASPINQPLGVTDLRASGHTHLQLFIALEPPLSVLPPIRDQFDSNEDPHLLQQASVWLRRLRENLPGRNFTATALDISGKHVFVTRFIHPQAPPPEVGLQEAGNKTQKLMECLAHYVSLVPFLPDAITFSGSCDIWTTSDQFLHMLAGDEEEHAVLLCNYFLHAGWKAWVLLGHAVPEGPTAYVLTEVPEGGVGHWLWNPSTGKHYGQHEAYCPLTSVGCVISNQNVWANIQDYEDPSRIAFDLNNSKHWRALFPTEMAPLATVQQELHYDETDTGKVQELQDRIERMVREHIMTLRSRFITRWNRHCTRILQSLLPRFEEHFSSPPIQEHDAELTEITASYKLSGFPLHFRYSDIRHILSTVERTGIHLNENRQVEFALGVYVHPYPNDVLSLWLYTASLVPK